jgi:hypothetical protein
VTLDERSSLPKAIVALCDDESVESVRLVRLEHGSRTPIWRVDGHGTGDIFQVVVGEVPPGFTEVVPLAHDLAGDLGLITDTAGGKAADSEQYFRIDELRVGVLDDGRYKSRNVTIGDLRTRAQLNCDPFGIPWDEAPLGLKAMYVAGAFVALTGAVAIGVLAVRLTRRRHRHENRRTT